MKNWYKNAVIYQIYPQSFKDTNNDGVGDIPGILEKLDYLSYLGVDAIWICPMYDSPNKDNGYDVRDYYNFQERYGSMKDFEKLIEEAHKRNIKIIMDLVLNHTSNECEWFLESSKSTNNSKSDYYIWKDPKPDGSAPTNWGAIFGGPTWTYSPERKQYYFHSFSPYQPDLNWDSQAMKQELFQMVEWWINKGVDGFRLDAINHISKNTSWPDGKLKKGEKYADIFKFAVNGPKIHTYLQEFKTEVLDKYNVMTVGEASSSTVKDALLFSKEIDMIFQFDHLSLDIDSKVPWGNKEISLNNLKRILSKWQNELYGKSWNALFWENHDHPRIVTRFGFDNTYREKCAKMLAVCMYFMQGTPFIYQGQELGIVNTEFYSRDETRDIEVKNAFNYYVDNGDLTEQEMLKRISRRSRDTSRSPMPWNNGPYSGFSTVEPWIKINQNYQDINVTEQLNRDNSCLNFYKQVIELRKQLDVIQNGNYKLLNVKNKNVFAYKRYGDGEIIVICNFSNQEEVVKYKFSKDASILLTNDHQSNVLQSCLLKPYEATVIKTK